MKRKEDHIVENIFYGMVFFCCVPHGFATARKPSINDMRKGLDL